MRSFRITETLPVAYKSKKRQQVLSPRKFLPREQRGVPRQDNRMEKLKAVIAGVLKQATSLKEFQNKVTGSSKERLTV